MPRGPGLPPLPLGQADDVRRCGTPAFRRPSPLLRAVGHRASLPTLPTPGSESVGSWTIDWGRPVGKPPPVPLEPRPTTALGAGTLSSFTALANNHLGTCWRMLPRQSASPAATVGRGPPRSRRLSVGSARAATPQPMSTSTQPFSVIWDDISSVWQEHLQVKRNLEDVGVQGHDGPKERIAAPASPTRDMAYQKSRKRSRKRTQTADVSVLGWERLGSPRTNNSPTCSAHQAVAGKIDLLRGAAQEWEQFQTHVSSVMRRHRAAVGRTHVLANRRKAGRSVKEQAERQAALRELWKERRLRAERLRVDEVERLARQALELERAPVDGEPEQSVSVEVVRAWATAVCLVSREAVWLDGFTVDHDAGKKLHAARSIQRWWYRARGKLKWRMSKQVAEHILARWLWQQALKLRQRKKPKYVLQLIDFMRRYNEVMTVPRAVSKLYRTAVYVQRQYRRGRTVRRARLALLKLQWEKEFTVRLVRCDKESERLRQVLVAGAEAATGLHQRIHGRSRKADAGEHKAAPLTAAELERIRRDLQSTEKEKKELEGIHRDIVHAEATTKLREIQTQHRQRLRAYQRELKDWQKKRDFEYRRYREMYVAPELLLDRFRRTVAEAREKRGKVGNAFAEMIMNAKREAEAAEAAAPAQPAVATPPPAKSPPQPSLKARAPAAMAQAPAPSSLLGGGKQQHRSRKASPRSPAASEAKPVSPQQSTLPSPKSPGDVEDLQVQDEQEMRKNLINMQVQERYAVLAKLAKEPPPVPPIFPLLFSHSQMTDVISRAAGRTEQLRRKDAEQRLLKSGSGDMQVRTATASIVEPPEGVIRGKSGSRGHLGGRRRR
eukprot:TRINITY_DN20167_c0_g1_i1.p1 TRINITY_DN20167_c0_g1~~TRINITY_DN20167_c0_g1_i1.p1  ORF type:complete len:861 (+),score=279.25 TRINITY_DN20167_c0_g1_i1:75-2585(+)